MAEEVSSFPTFSPFLGLSKGRRRSGVNNETSGRSELPRNRGSPVTAQTPVWQRHQRFQYTCGPPGGGAVAHHIPVRGASLHTICLMTGGPPHGAATSLPAFLPTKHHLTTAPCSMWCELRVCPCPPGVSSCKALCYVFPGVFSLWILTTCDRWFPDKEVEFKET